MCTDKAKVRAKGIKLSFLKKGGISILDAGFTSLKRGAVYRWYCDINGIKNFDIKILVFIHKEFSFSYTCHQRKFLENHLDVWDTSLVPYFCFSNSKILQLLCLWGILNPNLHIHSYKICQYRKIPKATLCFIYLDIWIRMKKSWRTEQLIYDIKVKFRVFNRHC